jgi:hypothetical protein
MQSRRHSMNIAKNRYEDSELFAHQSTLTCDSWSKQPGDGGMAVTHSTDEATKATSTVVQVN